LFVSYAEQELPEKTDDAKGPGHGFVDLFDANGAMLERLISRDSLNSPWGMVVTPADYGNIPHRLLVGNFGDGRINVYTLALSALHIAANFEGFIGNEDNQPLVIEGLWALAFAPNAGGFNPKHLHFTAGPNDEKNGLFGRLELPQAN
jgi:uncharacterized protein (TIGR03118 family)